MVIPVSPVVGIVAGCFGGVVVAVSMLLPVGGYVSIGDIDQLR